MSLSLLALSPLALGDNGSESCEILCHSQQRRFLPRSGLSDAFDSDKIWCESSEAG